MSIAIIYPHANILNNRLHGILDAISKPDEFDANNMTIV